MNYNFSSSPRVGSCIPTRTACTTDPRYHNNFGPHCHNHFNLHRHDHFDPCCNGLGLDIYLPDVKIPPCPDVKCPDPCPDVKCPDIPACPDVKCPDIPACPECPACPEPKKPIDFSKLSIVVDAVSGEIKDAKTKESSGLMFAKCKEIIDKNDNNLEIAPDNRIRGQCDSNPECKACVDAINASIVDVRKESAFSPEEILAPEYNVFII
ncbi:hypothetical protein [Wolbachia endosymbiont of Tribolium confusum]|uniref:hypothetical protein n=1 Tax=Wolbachia endosymbiont of Tribolium confusum TaxID=214474 RepID=UPI001CF5EFDD|nr:hypothetical protein [Wolbachia endosymbiont of Tribolium confusum]MCA7010978.1 hypothetical protein [Wolbachia endosymbiont of Tribolium confusum]